jgi:hypothetical protein
VQAVGDAIWMANKILDRLRINGPSIGKRREESRNRKEKSYPDFLGPSCSLPLRHRIVQCVTAEQRQDIMRPDPRGDGEVSAAPV